jgi:hypothetical protein
MQNLPKFCHKLSTFILTDWGHICIFTRALTKSLKYAGMWGYVEQNGALWGVYGSRPITHIYICR